MLKKHIAFTALFMLNYAAIAQSVPTDTDTIGTFRFTLMPESHLVPLFTADQRAHRISFLNLAGTSEFIGSMGGVFPIVRIERNEKALQFSAASSLYTTLVRHTGGGSLINTDFFVDLFFDLKLHERFLV